MTLPTTPRAGDTATLAALRNILLGTFVVGVVGVGVELLLLEHFEDPWQLAPLALFALALLVVGWHVAARSAASVQALRAMLALFVASGVVGQWLHYQGNMEFELERDPNLGGLALLRESMMGATPALAPGTMVLLALVGLAYTYRHPALGIRGEAS